MGAETVPLQLPDHVFAELKSLAEEERADPVEIIARLVAAARHRRTWTRDLAALRERILEDGGLHVGDTREEVVERLRQTRREIFEAEYAHLYR